MNPNAATCSGRICVQGTLRTPKAIAFPGDSGMPYVLATKTGSVLVGVHRSHSGTFGVGTAVGGQLPWIRECMRRCHLIGTTARWAQGDPQTFRGKKGIPLTNTAVIDINFPENMTTVTAAGKARVAINFAVKAPGITLPPGTWSPAVRPAGHPTPSCTTKLLLTEVDCTGIIVKQASEQISVYFPVRWVSVMDGKWPAREPRNCSPPTTHPDPPALLLVSESDEQCLTPPPPPPAGGGPLNPVGPAQPCHPPTRPGRHPPTRPGRHPPTRSTRPPASSHWHNPGRYCRGPGSVAGLRFGSVTNARTDSLDLSEGQSYELSRRSSR